MQRSSSEAFTASQEGGPVETPATQGRFALPRNRKIAGTIAAVAMAAVFGAWGPVACEDLSSNPRETGEPCSPAPPYDTCAASQRIFAKRGLENRLYWEWAEGTFVAFTVADHRAWFSWGYNLDTRNIRWIEKSGQGRCLTPIGSCSIEYGIWRTEVCDRTGPDTCLFRRESDAKVSFTYGVAFNRHLISCLGTRINWDGSHVRNTWGGDCSGASAATTASMQNQKLTIGKGKNEVRVDRYLSGDDIKALDHACISKTTADRLECGKVAKSLYRKLPADLRRSVKGAL
jgi:hypothetical protein